MVNFSISQEIINVIESLYVNSNSTILINHNTEYFSHTTVEVRKCFLLSPLLFDICLEQKMQDTLQNHTLTIYYGDNEIRNFSFSDALMQLFVLTNIKTSYNLGYRRSCKYVVIKYTRNRRINATIFMQENVVIKFTRNRCINATIFRQLK